MDAERVVEESRHGVPITEEIGPGLFITLCDGGNFSSGALDCSYWWHLHKKQTLERRVAKVFREQLNEYKNLQH